MVSLSVRCTQCIKFRCSDGCQCDCHHREYSRFTLYGKSVSEEQLRKHITNLRTGNLSKNIEPLNPTEIARRLGKSRQFVYDYLKKATELDEISTDEKGTIIIDKESLQAKKFKEFGENHPITTDPLVESWIDAMKFRGHTGKGRKGANLFVLKIEQICNSLHIEPVQLTMSLKQTEEYAQAFYNKIESGEFETRTSTRTNSGIDQIWYQHRMAIRSFAINSGVSIPKGHGGILSGKIVSHALYADLELSDKQISDVEKYIIDTWGLDSDIYRMTMFGIETGARRKAMMNATLDFKETTDEDSTVFTMSVIETKTEHIEGGKIEKFIQRQKTQESLKLAKQKGYTKLWDSKNITESKFYVTLCKQLKEIYRYLGIAHHYFYEKPVHVLRHIAVHYWLRLTDYDYVFVAKIIGISVQELIKSYGKMPIDVMWKKLKKSRKGLDQL